MARKVILIRNAHSYDFGGGERFPVFVADILAKEGLSPVIVSRNPRLIDFAQNKGIGVVRGWWWSNQNWSGWRVLLLPAYIGWQVILYYWYIQLYKTEAPDVVHVQSKDDFIAATLAAKRLNIKTVWTDHADLKHIWLNVSRKLKNPIGKWILSVARYTSSITVVSESEYREITKHLNDNRIMSKLTVVHNGVEDRLNDFEYEPSDSFVFCAVSRLVSDKGIAEAITAFKEFRLNHPQSKLVIVGDGPEEDRFRVLAKSAPGVELAGYQTEPLRFVASADVFIHPTYHEGFSVSLVEATMMQKPIIATNVGGNPEIIIDNQTGILIPPKNSSALLSAMEKLYENSDLRDRLSANARKQYLEKFVFNKIVKERFIPLYEKDSN